MFFTVKYHVARFFSHKDITLNAWFVFSKNFRLLSGLSFSYTESDLGQENSLKIYYTSSSELVILYFDPIHSTVLKQVTTLTHKTLFLKSLLHLHFLPLTSPNHLNTNQKKHMYDYWQNGGTVVGTVGKI